MLMQNAAPKLYRVYFSGKEPLFAEFYSDKIFEIHPVGIFGKKLVGGEVYNFVIVLALDENDAMDKAKQYQPQ